MTLFAPAWPNGLKRKKTPETDTDTETDTDADTKLDKYLKEAQSLQLSALKNVNKGD